MIYHYILQLKNLGHVTHHDGDNDDDNGDNDDDDDNDWII